jgi:hypothetical protein
MSANSNGWQYPRRGIWILGPLTIRREVEPRTNVYEYELFDSTRYVDKFPNLAAAMAHAQQLGWSVAS